MVGCSLRKSVAMSPLKRVQDGKEISANNVNKSKLDLPEGIWNNMDNEVLVSIMKLISYEDRSRYLYYVCKSWRTAVLDSMFPVGDVLDLRFLDD